MKAYAAMGLLHAGIAVALRAAGGFTPMTSELTGIGNAQIAPGHGGCDRRGHRGGRRVPTAGPAKVEEANAAEGQPLYRVT